MSEKNEEEKQENSLDYTIFQDLPLYRKIAEILVALKESKIDEAKMRVHLNELFEEYTRDKHYLSETGSIEWKERHGLHAIEKAAELIAMFEISFCLKASRSIISEFWNIWCSKRKIKNEKDKEALDQFALECLKFLEDDKAFNLFYYVKNKEGLELKIDYLLSLAKNEYVANSYFNIYLGTFLRKLGDVSFFWVDKGQELVTKGYILQAKDELRIEFSTSIENKIDQASKEIDSKIVQSKEETNKIVDDTRKDVNEFLGKELAKSEQKTASSFIQILGIFAAIIAFVVTIVPTAVRLGGASVPIALAGLAIVTAGIILLLAMIFGREANKPRRGLGWGLASAIVLFLFWLGFTAWLAINYPKTLVTAKEDNASTQPAQRIEAQNLYMLNSAKDTVGTPKVSPPPPPSTKEGE